jgi:parallel beta-helix repeat protein
MIPNRKALVCIGLLVIAGAVQAQTLINTCPFVITSPGDYLLAADLICGGGDGITINAGGVRLALEGHKITAGVGAKRAIVAVSPSQPPFILGDVRILGPGLITNGGANTFSAGVSLTFVDNSEVSGITVRGASGPGIVAPECTSLIITANTLGGNSEGLSLGDCGATVSKNDVSGNDIGIFYDNIGAPKTITVSHNVINGNTSGVVIVGSMGATFQNNVISGNGTGIFVPQIGVFGLKVTNNTSLANGNFDLFDGSAVCAGTVWSGNTFFNANQTCIH